MNCIDSCSEKELLHLPFEIRQRGKAYNISQDYSSFLWIIMGKTASLFNAFQNSTAVLA
jgi:hypothetical protein